LRGFGKDILFNKVTISLLLNKLINERGFDEASAMRFLILDVAFGDFSALQLCIACGQEQILRKAIPFLPVPSALLLM